MRVLGWVTMWSALPSRRAMVSIHSRFIVMLVLRISGMRLGAVLCIGPVLLSMVTIGLVPLMMGSIAMPSSRALNKEPCSVVKMQYWTSADGV